VENKESPQSGEVLAVLHGQRAISIVLVLATHMLPLGPKAWRLNETAGVLGMSLFFVLSGFLITRTLSRNPDLCEFLVRRFARILPLAYTYTAVIFLFVSFNLNSLLWTNLFAVNYLVQYLNAWNGHFWSLCVEMHFYLAIALVLLAGGRKSLWMVWPACLIMTLVRMSVSPGGGIATHLQIDEILSGACAARLYPYFSRLNFRVSFGLLGSIFLVSAVFSSPMLDSFGYVRAYTAALTLLAMLNYGAANPETFLASRPMVYLANISYALYVIHPATVYGFMSEGSLATKYLLKRPVSFALTFILAHISTFYWERRWHLIAQHWLHRRRTRLASMSLAASARE
jgi:peptidoglycan/LPS O-acetylase OafA/YrhL